MEAVLSIFNRSGFRTPTQANGWYRLSSPELLSMAAMNLLATERKALPGEVLQVLQLITTEDAGEVTSRASVWLDLSGLPLAAHRRNEAEYRDAALSYCISRQAHFPMLKRLFGTTQKEVRAIRERKCAALPPTKPPVVSTKEVTAIFEGWKRVCTEYEAEIDRWIALGEVFPSQPLSSLYTMIYIEGKGQ